MTKSIIIENTDRLELLRLTNILRDFNCNTSEKIPIEYNHVCEMETLMFQLARLLEFDKESHNWYQDYDLKENLFAGKPKEKKEKVN